jgi:2'-5' RNA ligase
MQNVIYNYSSTQIYLPDELSDEIVEWGNKHVPDKDLYIDPADPSFGRENEIHITVLYGIHSDDLKPIQNILAGVKPIHCKLGRITLFDTNKFDVVKIDVESPDLHALNVKLQALEHTNGYPVYKPHVTIAYVLKDRGKRWINCKAFLNKTFVAHDLIFSTKSGKKIALPIQTARSS